MRTLCHGQGRLIAQVPAIEGDKAALSATRGPASMGLFLLFILCVG